MANWAWLTLASGDGKIWVNLDEATTIRAAPSPNQGGSVIQLTTGGEVVVSNSINDLGVLAQRSTPKA